MQRKYLITVLAGICFVVLLACRASAEYWPDRASMDSPVYPRPVFCETGDLDGNGVLEPADARAALRLSVGLDRDMDDPYPVSADMDGDGAVSPADARQILRYAVGLDGYSPAGTDGSAFFACVYSFRRNDVASDLESLLRQTVNGAQPGEWEDGRRLPLWRLSSPEETERFAGELVQTGGIETVSPAPPVQKLLGRYGESFFAVYDLFLCLCPQSCSSDVPAVYPPSAEEGGLTIPVGFVSTVYQTPDVANRLLLIPLKKDSLSECVSFHTAYRKAATLTTGEYDAAVAGVTRWEFANKHLLERDGSAERTTGGVYYVALHNLKNSRYRWVCEADCEIREYRPSDLTFERGETGNCVYLREETVTAPGPESENAPILQYFMIASPDAGEYELRFRRKYPEGETLSQPSGEGPAAAETDGRTLFLKVLPPIPTVTPTVARAVENGAVATSSKAPFRLGDIILGRSSLMGQYNNCLFRGVIEAIDRSDVSWKTKEGKQSGPYCRALLKVRVTQHYRGIPDLDSVSVLYVYDLNDDGPIAVRTGREYLFVDCRLTDEVYYEKAAAVLPDFVEKDETLHRADMVAGPARYTFLPVEDGRCTVYEGYFSDDQLKRKEDIIEYPALSRISGTDYMTVDAEQMWMYLCELNIWGEKMLY